MRDKERPEGWEDVPLGEVATFTRGITFPASAKAHTQGEGLITCLRTTNVQHDVDWNDLIYVPESYVKRPDRLIRPGDILISMANSLELVGKVALVDSDPPKSTFGGFISVIRPSPRTLPKYLFYALRSSETQEAMRETASRSVNIANLALSRIGELTIPLPPLSVQQRLVEKIERLLEQSRTAREALDRIPPLLRRFRQSVLAKAFRGELTEGDPNDEPAAVLLERIREERRRKWEEDLRARGKDPGKAKYVEPEPPDASGLRDLPEGWVWASVAQVGDVRLGRQRSPSRAIGPNMTPYLRAANVTWTGLDLRDVKQMDFTQSEQGVYRLHAGDVVLSEASGSASEAGKPAIWRDEIPGCCFQNTLIRVRSGQLPPEYLRYHFLDDAISGRFAEATTGIGINHLGANKLSRSPIALAPLPEQRRIVATLDAHLAQIDAIGMAVTRARRRAENVDQAVLARAFRGEL